MSATARVWSATRRVVRVGELAHVLLCGALAIPVAIIALMGTPMAGLDPATMPSALSMVVSFLVLLAVLATTLARFVRPVQIVTARTLLGLDLPDPIAAPTTATRLLGTGWFIVCAAIGFVVTVVVVFVLPLAVHLVLAPFAGDTVRAFAFPTIVLAWWPTRFAAVLVGVVVIAAALCAIWAAGRALTEFAPVFLGPTDADRRVLEARRAADAARANRIARELHDSVGHALTAIAVQASAAKSALERDDDRGDVVTPLSAIESLARDALEELDSALGALRAGGTPPNGTTQGAPRPRAIGATDASAPAERLRTVLETAARVLDLDLEASPTDLEVLPPVVASETVRIAQESLTNAVRHGDGTASMRLEHTDDRVHIVVRNRIGVGLPGSRLGGRGLAGMRERAMLIGGTVDAGPTGDGDWLVDVTLPLDAHMAHVDNASGSGGTA